jgi:hypothetical protein
MLAIVLNFDTMDRVPSVKNSRIGGSRPLAKAERAGRPAVFGSLKPGEFGKD